MSKYQPTSFQLSLINNYEDVMHSVNGIMVLLRHLHRTHWSWRKSEASFCAPRGPMRAIYEDRIWQTQFPRCCAQNMELFTATSPFANHQPTTVPVRTQNSSLQTRLHMTFTSENYWTVNLLTCLPVVKVVLWSRGGAQMGAVGWAPPPHSPPHFNHCYFTK